MNVHDRLIALTPARAGTIGHSAQLLAAFVLGVVILYGVGFVELSMVHNAAHDMRHAQGFPCH